jgi:hypothetical protein
VTKPTSSGDLLTGRNPGARRWLDPHWYHYLRARHPEAALTLFIVLLTCAGVGGFFAYLATDANPPAKAQRYVALKTTVTKVVRTREHGKVVLKRVAVVRRVFAKPVQVVETQTIQTPGGTKVVTRAVTRYQPVYRRKVITVHGKPVTVSQVVTDTRMLTDTQLLTTTNVVTSTVVNERSSTVVNERTNTVNVTVTQPVTIVRTETSPGQTVTETITRTETRTETSPPVTVTGPGDTVTVTVTTP